MTAHVPSFVAPLTAQAAWTKLKPATSPTARKNHVMCTDTARKVTVLFGSVGKAETWEYDGKNWKKMSPKTSPPGLGFAGMSYDTKRKVCVLFGGRVGSFRMNRTWEWNGVDWSLIKTSNRPAIRYGHAQCYDFRRGVTVVFSGYNSGPYYYTDTWEYDGKNWRQVAKSGPIGRIYSYMEYDLLRGKCVLFSGYSAAASPAKDIQDTWEWDGKGWKEIKLACQPLGRWGHSMQLALPRGIVMFGGHRTSPPSPGAKQDTWMFDGKSWSEIKPSGSPTARRLHAMAAEPTSLNLMLFGGSVGAGETQLLNLRNFSRAGYETHLAGCKGSNGVPALGTLNCNQPFLTETLSIQVTGIPKAATVYLIFGLSNTVWGTNPLPMDWSFMGYTGCSLGVSLDAFFTMQTNGTKATFPAAMVPNNARLVGVRFYNQAYVFDSKANPAGATLSNAITARIGRR